MEHLVCATPSAKYQEYKSKTQILPEKLRVLLNRQFPLP